jgi:hypothetical protein
VTDAEFEGMINFLRRTFEKEYACPQRLRRGASPTQIESCERAIERPFSASYKHFLRLHDGWENYDGQWLLLGTVDFSSEEIRAALKTRVDDFIRGISASEVSSGELEQEIDPADAEAVERWISEFEENEDWLCLPKHTIIGFTPDSDGMLLLDVNTRSPGGEMNVVKYYFNSGVQDREANFYEFIRREYRSWRVRQGLPGSGTQ